MANSKDTITEHTSYEDSDNTDDTITIDASKIEDNAWVSHETTKIPQINFIQPEFSYVYQFNGDVLASIDEKKKKIILYMNNIMKGEYTIEFATDTKESS